MAGVACQAAMTVANNGRLFPEADQEQHRDVTAGAYGAATTDVAALSATEQQASRQLHESVTIRTLRRDEVPAAYELLFSHWPTIASLGYHYALYDAHPGGWLCATIGSAIVGIAIFAKFPDGSGFGGYRVVRKDYMGKGVGERLRIARLEHFTSNNFGVNSLDNLLESNSRAGYQVVSFRLVTFCGVVDVVAAAALLAELESRRQQQQRQQGLPTGDGNDAITLAEVRQPSEDLLRYDAHVNAARRDAFVTLFTALPESYTVVARRPDGVVVGYGTLHRGSRCHHMAPLYADNERVAELIFASLVARLQSGDSLLWTAPSQNAVAARLAEGIGLPVDFEAVRIYTRSEVALPLQKVYAMATLDSSFA